MNEQCYILIDSGAIITEMNNHDVAKYIMSILPDKFDGVVYFHDKTNKLTVYLRN